MKSNPPADTTATADKAESLAEPCALAEEAGGWERRDVLLSCLLMLATFYTIYFTRSLLLPVTLALILNLVFKPIVLWLEKLRIPHSISATLVFCSFGGIALVGIDALWEPANHWFATITEPGYFESIGEKLKPVQKPLEELERASEKIESLTASRAGEEPIEVQIDQPRLGSLVNSTWGVFGGLAIMLILLFFLLAAGDQFLLKLVELMPTWGEKRRVVDLSREIQNRISSYLFTITAINVLLGLAIGIGMWLIGLSNPALWGVAAGLLNFIPFAGLATGAVLVFVVGLADFSSLEQAALAPLIYVSLNILEANFITPALLSKSVSLNPVMIILSVFFWGWIWGIGGVLLAVPLLVILKITLEHSQTLTPLGNFLAAGNKS